MEPTHHYLSENLAAPEDLTEIYQHLERELSARQRSSFSHVQRRRLLIEGSSIAPTLGGDVGFWPNFLDVRDVVRTHAGIEQYLGRLIAPDDHSSAETTAREVIREHLGIAELDETADSLCDLDQIEPGIVTALLQLRIGRASELFEVAKLGRVLDRHGEPIGIYEWLLEEFVRISIAYRLRIIAMQCAGQIHAPLRWDALDGLEQAAAAGTLRLGTLLDRLRAELNLTEKAFDLFSNNRHRVLQRGFLTHKPLIDQGAVRLSFAGLDLLADEEDTAAFKAHGLDSRARVQLALWRARHGDDLEAILEQTIARMRRDLDELRRRLEERAKQAHRNATVGNIGRTAAGVILHFAVEEAVAWTAAPISHAKGHDDQCTVAANTGRTDAICLALKWLRSNPSTRGEFPKPKPRSEHASTVAELFMALRFEFLRDNDMLPMALRRVKHSRSERLYDVKSPDRAARILGRHYTFQELWDAFQNVRQQKIKKLPKDASPKALSQAYQVDHDIKRAAKRVRSAPSFKIPADAVGAMTAISASVQRGLLTQ